MAEPRAAQHNQRNGLRGDRDKGSPKGVNEWLSGYVAVGVIDVKSYYIESPQDVADRVRLCLKHAPADKLSFAPDCGLSQTARWAAKQKPVNLVEGVRNVRKELGL